jgi:hypothetical protein
MTAYVYSTLATSVACAQYRPYDRPGANGKQPMRPPVLLRKVEIRGGTGVADKRLITPFGVGTQVSDDDLAFLMAHPKFQKWLEGGFMRVVQRKTDPEVVAADMSRDDPSAPLTPGDFADGKGPTVGGRKAA